MSLQTACRYCADPVPFWQVCPTWLQDIAEERYRTAYKLLPLEVLEIFCGVGNLHQACADAGLRSLGLDLLNGPSEDLLTMPGFLRAVDCILSVQDKGLVWFAPPCSNWTFLSSSVHRRSEENSWLGDTSHPDVRQANNLAYVTAALIRLAASCGLAVVIEQPSDSCLFKFGPVRKAVAMLGCSKMQTYLSGFSTDVLCPKPMQLIGTSVWLGSLYRAKPDRPFQTDAAYTRGLDGRVSGGARLSETAVYPTEFGQAVAQLVLRARGTRHECRPHSLLEDWEARCQQQESDEAAADWICLRP